MGGTACSSVCCTGAALRRLCMLLDCFLTRVDDFGRMVATGYLQASRVREERTGSFYYYRTTAHNEVYIAAQILHASSSMHSTIPEQCCHSRNM